jgi:hypothetical protein
VLLRRLLLGSLLLRLVMADRAARGGAQHTVMTGHVTGGAAHRRTGQAAGVCRPGAKAGSQGECQGGGKQKRLHRSILCWAGSYRGCQRMAWPNDPMRELSMQAAVVVFSG